MLHLDLQSTLRPCRDATFDLDQHVLILQFEGERPHQRRKKARKLRARE